MLKPLTNWRHTVSLVPFSGVQFMDYGFDKDAVGSFKRQFIERVVAREGDAELRTLIPLTDDDEENARRIGAPQEGDEDISINRERALEPFLDKWVPVPFLRVLPARGAGGEELYDRGPTNWARVRVVPLADRDAESGTSHRVVFAFDTELATKSPNRSYVVPAPGDAEDEATFRLVSEPVDMQWFLAAPDEGSGQDPQKWVDDWLMELFVELRRAARPGRPVRVEDFPYRLEHWARYLSFVAFLDAALSPRPVRLVDTLTKGRYTPAEVDLVLDVGNSRTCAMLVDSHVDRNRVDLSDSYVMELRDLGRPERVYREPFESRVEFSQGRFGRDHIARRAGRARSFFWPSLVRIGPESLRLTGEAEGNETTTGMSSPKRYLWDARCVNQDWRFQESDYPAPGQEPPALTAVRRHVNDAGDVISQIKREISLGVRRRASASEDGTMRARFSRSALYSFMIAEVVAQALMLINGPATRHGLKEPDLPRKLRSVIMTLPPATPLQEQQLMRSRAEAGIRLIWDMLGWRDKGAPEPPKVSIDWDEASCNQLVYLYDAIVHRFSGEITPFLELMGKTRPFQETPGETPPGTEPTPSLRIASLDIGGGTTDLMITTYHAEANRALVPTQNFREGFRIAGDDVVKAIIEEVVVAALRQALETAGRNDARELLKQLFGGDQAQMSEQERHRRRQFAIRVLQPTALSVMRAYESARATADREPGYLRIGDVVAPEGDEGEAQALYGYVDEAVNGTDFRVADVEVPVVPDRIDAVIGRVMRELLHHVGEAVWSLDCDLLLLAGRPSRLPAVRDILREQLAVTPDRVVAMDDYRIGTWYPFRSRDNVHISDPKTTAAVGCMLCALADPERPDGSRIGNFTLMTRRLQMRSTARFIGEMSRNGQIWNDKLLFADLDLDAAGQGGQRADIQMFAPMRIGFRQLPYERWTATPLYLLDFTPGGGRRSKPFTVTVERADVDDVDEETSPDPQRQARNEALRRQAEAMREAFAPTEVVDAQGDPCRLGDVELRLHTLGFDDSYWLDTGVLELR